MKNKNGFTLVELLGALVIMMLLAAIVLPNINAISKSSRNDLYETQIHIIEEAARLWGARNLYNLPENDGESVTISLLQLKLSGFLEPDIENPKTEELFPDDMNIVITKSGHTYFYEVLEDTGTKNEPIDPNAPLITLNGGIVQNVEINTTFTDLGATAESRNQKTLEITKRITQDGNETTIDTSKLGTYIITYSATDNGKTTSIERKVQIIDTLKPVLTCASCPLDLIVEVESSPDYILPTVTATDNSLLSGNLIVTKEGSFSSIIPGTKRVIYKAVDASGNVGTLDVTFVVKDTIAPTVTILESINATTNVTTVTITASDSGTGLNTYPYSFDGGNSWQMQSSAVFKEGETYDIVVRDKAGNLGRPTS